MKGEHGVESKIEVPELRVGGTSLRPWTESDLSLIASAATDPYVPLITSVPARYSPEGGREWLERQWAQANERRGCSLAIADAASDTAVGYAGISSISWPELSADVGYWVLASERGRGYARNAVGLLVELGRALGLRKLRALIEPDNLGSIRSVEAHGFQVDKTTRAYRAIGGTEREMAVYWLDL